MAVSINLKLERCASSRHVGFFCLCILTKMISCVILCGINYGNPWVQWPDICLVTQGECSNVIVVFKTRRKIIFVHIHSEVSKNCGTEKSIGISLRMRLSSRINLVNSRSLSEFLNVSASAIIGVMNMIVLPRPYVNMRERIVFVAYRYRSRRQCFDLHDRVISDERGICMPAIGKVCRYSYNDIYEPGCRWHTTYAELSACVNVWDTTSNQWNGIDFSTPTRLPPTVEWNGLIWHVWICLLTHSNCIFLYTFYWNVVVSVLLTYFCLIIHLAL